MTTATNPMPPTRQARPSGMVKTTDRAEPAGELHRSGTLTWVQLLFPLTTI